MKKVFVEVFFLLVLLVIGGSIFYYTNLQSVSEESKNEDVVFVINKGDTTKSIAKRLQSKGLIRDQNVFLLYLYLTNQIGKVQAGTFQLSKNFSVPHLVKELRQGRVDVLVTFVEGQRREEYGLVLEEKLGLSAKEFISLTTNREGELFPDSYLFPTDVVVGEVIKKLSENFEKKWQTLETDNELDRQKILILASLIEREVKLAEDRKIVSGILIKRLREGWPLQIDASVQYAKANNQCKMVNGQMLNEECTWWPKVTGNDLKNIDSPYNTYIYKGLPPAPICNPSLASIKSVINYQDTEYWYYISDNQGKMRYAETLEEHNKNINRYLK
jgi:UPF0755 protein